ncbi:hypothetical protein [Gemmata sp.]|uniref:hypothetical protein n=1 Tax=Gemmata sp. TaxID=1914242 RepID=UPI003F6ED12B
MYRFLSRVLARCGDSAARGRVFALETELARAQSRISVLEAERDGLAEVVARDRARVASETATFHRATVGRSDQ